MAESIEELVLKALREVKISSSGTTTASYTAVSCATGFDAPRVEVRCAELDSAIRAASEKKGLEGHRASVAHESEIIDRQRELLDRRKRKKPEGASSDSALEKLILIHATHLPGIRREGKIADLTRDVYERYIMVFCPVELAEWLRSCSEQGIKKKIQDVLIKYITRKGSYVERTPLLVVDVNPKKIDEWRILPEVIEIKGMESQGNRKIGLLTQEREIGAGGSGTAYLYSDVLSAETEITELGPVRICGSVVVKKANPDLIGTLDEDNVVDGMIREGFIGDEIRRVEHREGVKLTNLGAPRFIPGSSAAEHRVISPWLDVSPTDAVMMYAKELGRTDLALVRTYQEMLNITGALAYVKITHNDIKVDRNGNMLARIAEPTDFSKLKRPERIPEKVWQLITEKPLCEGPVMTVFDFGSANLPGQKKVPAFTPYNVDDAYVIMSGANFWSDVYMIGLAMADIFTDFVFLEARRTEKNSPGKTTAMMDYMRDFNKRRDKIFGKDFIQNVLKYVHHDREERMAFMQPDLELLKKSNREWYDIATEACKVLDWNVNIPYLARAHTLPLEERFLKKPETTDNLVRVYNGLCSNIRRR